MNQCLHCEARPQETMHRLCKQCESNVRIKRLYLYTDHWTPERDRRLQQFVERAKRRLPLFPNRG